METFLQVVHLFYKGYKEVHEEELHAIVSVIEGFLPCIYVAYNLVWLDKAWDNKL